MMPVLFFSFALLAVPVLALALIAGRARRALPAVALTLAAVVLGLAYAAGAELLGRPKPLRLAALERGAGEAVVLASHYEEGRAIFLWLVLPGASAPRAYVMPWSQQAAEALLRAERAAEERGTQVVMRDPFGASDSSSEGRFEVLDLPPLPPKPGG